MIVSRYLIGLWILGISLVTTLQGEQNVIVSSKTLIPRQYLFGNPEKASPQISSKASKLAYLAPDEQNVLNVWIRDLEKKGKDIQVTKDQKRGVRQYLWQMDEKNILYVQDKDGDENWHLYQTNIETQKTIDLTPFPNVKVQILDTDPRFPHEILIEMNKRDPAIFDVYRLDLQTGKIALEIKNPGNVYSWAADHNLQVRISQAFTSDGSTLIRIKDQGDGTWRDWLTVDPNETAVVQGFSADNQSIYLMTNHDVDTIQLLKIHSITGERTLLAQDPHYDLSSLIQHPTTYQPEVVSLERERSDWIVLDPLLKADYEYLSEKLKGPFILSSRDLSNQNWIVASLSDRRPNHFYLYHRQTRALEFLFSTQPSLERYSLSPMKPITFQARDGLTLHGYLTLPLDKELRNLPVVLLVHGGPWARDSWGLQPTVQWLANRGYAVLQVNFRGSTGYGKKYLNAGNREWASKMHTDLIDGKNWLIQQGYADPSKIAISGGSYGGYAALVAVTFTPDEFCCAVDLVGPSNLITLLQTLPPYWSSMKVLMDLRVGKLETEEEFLKSRSPLFKAEQIKKPLLIGQGANDPRVKQAESDQIVSAMREKNLPVEYLLFADEGHGFAKPENRLKFYAAMESFFAKYLGGLLQPPTTQENWDSHKR